MQVERLEARGRQRVGVVGEDVRQAQVVRTIEDEVLAYLDLEKNERVIVSQLSGVTDGMQVRLTVNNEEAGS